MDRRRFFRLTAATSAGATLAGCGNPENQVIRFIPDETLTPGLAEWRPTICPLCPAGCGLTARVMQGDVEVIRDGLSGIVSKALVKKVDGNPEHPVSRGKTCVRGQASIQVTYHPDRITGPLRLTGERGSGEFTPVSWDDALEEVATRLNLLRTAGRPEALASVTRPLTGQRRRLLGLFMDEFGARPPDTFEVFSDEVLRRANEASFGFYQLPTLDIRRSMYVISFGADILGTWNSPVAQGVGYGTMRQGRPGIRAKFVQIEPRMSQTGANADEWLPARPGTEGMLALGLAHAIMAEGLRSPADAGRAGRILEGWSEGLPAFTPEETESRTGVAASKVRRLAREFASNSPALAVIAGPPLAQTNGFASALAVNALNALVGSVAREGGLVFTPVPPMTLDTRRDSPAGALFRSILESEDSPVEVLLTNDTNPVFGAPPSWRVPEALGRIPFIVSFAQFVDETSAWADLILPDHSFLESWMDHVPESGTTRSVASVAPPAMRPLYDTRSAPDVLLDLSRRFDPPLASIPWTRFEDMLEEAFRELPETGDGWDVWGGSAERGGWWREEPLRAAADTPAPLAGVTLAEPDFDGDSEAYPFNFLPYPSQAFLDGSLAHLPWLQELPDVLSTAMWSSWVEINPATAARLGVTDGDLVAVTSAHGSLEAPVLLYPGIGPDLIAMPVGQGHETFTRYASGRGANPLGILSPAVDSLTGAPAWAATRVSVTRIEGRGNLILFAGALREHSEFDR